jgi:ADP-heptose:LPS heptosyltransferase
MRSIYLPIRSFGDFIITAAIIKSNFSEKVPIIIPDYITDIFEAINGGKYFEPVGVISYKNQPAFFELYKVKDVANIKRLITDVLMLRSFVNKKDHYILDYSSRRINFTGAHFVWPSKNENIYEAKATLLTREGLIGLQKPEATERLSGTKIQKIIIVPDSRLFEKSIDTGLISSIINAFKPVEIKIARFSKEISADKNVISYSSFQQLIQLISTADLIISAESLPYHLANYLDKPHFVIYKESRHFKSTFMTPYMLNKKSYSIYTGNNVREVIADIARAISAK